MREHGARTLTFTTGQAQAQSRLIGGPVRLCGWSANGGAGTTDTPVQGSVTSPGAGATIASVSLGNGTYNVAWTIEMSGTLAAADIDNVQLLLGATVVADSVDANGAGTYPQQAVEVTVANGPLVLAAKTIGAGTVGAVYKVTMVVTPTSVSTATIFDGGQPIAYIVMDTQGNQTFWIDSYGVAVETELSVLTTNGTMSGVLWYDMVYHDDEHEHDKVPKG